jgi:hypothetical protein
MSATAQPLIKDDAPLSPCWIRSILILTAISRLWDIPGSLLGIDAGTWG